MNIYWWLCWLCPAVGFASRRLGLVILAPGASLVWFGASLTRLAFAVFLGYWLLICTGPWIVGSFPHNAFACWGLAGLAWVRSFGFVWRFGCCCWCCGAVFGAVFCFVVLAVVVGLRGGAVAVAVVLLAGCGSGSFALGSCLICAFEVSLRIKFAYWLETMFAI